MAECKCLALKLSCESLGFGLSWLRSPGLMCSPPSQFLPVCKLRVTGSQLPLKKHHSTTAILTIHNLQSIWRDLMSSDESVCSSCFFPRHSHWLRVKEENCANLSSLPHTRQTHVSSQAPCRQDHNGPKVFADEARNAFLALTGYAGSLCTSLNFLSESFLSLRCVDSTPTHTLQSIRTRECSLRVVLCLP